MTDRSPSIPLSEVEIVQNPAIAALMLWNYGRSYQDTVERTPSPMLPLFLILPLCLHRPTLEIANSTLPNSGLGKFCEKLSVKREELFAVHERAIVLRGLTLNAISFGVNSGLLKVNYEEAVVQFGNVDAPTYPERIKPLMKGAKRFGVWFRSLNTIEIFKALRVEA